MTAGALLVLIPVELALGGAGARWPRQLSFGAWGLTAGFVLWDDWLPLPYLTAGAALLLWSCRRELFGRAGAMLAAGVVRRPWRSLNCAEPLRAAPNRRETQVRMGTPRTSYGSQRGRG